MFYWILLIWILVGGSFSVLLWDIHGIIGSFDYLNPLFVYDYYYNLNWFGVICLTLFYNLVCPLVTVIYWFYKLCTVGRR